MGRDLKSAFVKISVKSTNYKNDWFGITTNYVSCTYQNKIYTK